MRRRPARPAAAGRRAPTDELTMTGVPTAVYPEDLRYTEEHEWVRTEGARATVGITDYAQDLLGDIVYVDLPEVGTKVQGGAPFGEIESTKSVSDLYSPYTGTVTARNDELDANPELVNADPYGRGWLVEIEVEAGQEQMDLLDAQGYAALVAEQ
jgi:glycine cleavage system H protein